MSEIIRYDVNREWAHSGIVCAGDFCFLNYCARNVEGTVEEQINGAFDEMEKRLAMAGLTFENVVQIYCLFKGKDCCFRLTVLHIKENDYGF